MKKNISSAHLLHAKIPNGASVFFFFDASFKFPNGHSAGGGRGNDRRGIPSKSVFESFLPTYGIGVITKCTGMDM